MEQYWYILISIWLIGIAIIIAIYISWLKNRRKHWRSKYTFTKRLADIREKYNKGS